MSGATTNYSIYTNSGLARFGDTIRIDVPSAGTKGLIVKGAASQTANLLEVQNNSSGVIFSVAADGNATLNTTSLGGLNITESSLGVPHLGLVGVSKQWNLQVQGNSNDDFYLNNITDGRIVISATTAGLVGIGTQLGSQFSVLIGSASRTGMIVRAAASQTANIAEWQSSTGAALVSVSATGRLKIDGSTADFTGLIVDTGLNRVGIMKYPGAFGSLLAGSTSDLILGHRTDSNDLTAASPTVRQDLKITAAGSIILSSAALATTATDGFTYVPTCAGTPTGTPTTQSGTVPVVYDTTNNKLYVYNGGWKSATFA
jgi:hypothetical protein